MVVKSKNIRYKRTKYSKKINPSVKKFLGIIISKKQYKKKFKKQPIVRSEKYQEISKVRGSMASGYDSWLNANKRAFDAAIKQRKKESSVRRKKHLGRRIRK